MYSLVQGDLFSAPNDFSLAQCISSDSRLEASRVYTGAGIALTFHQRYGGIQALPNQTLLSVAPKIGSLVYLEVNPERYLFYLVTKDYYFHKPSYTSLTLSLITLCHFCLDRDIYKLALSKIGCGPDGLQWSHVENLIKDIFSDTAIEIRVYSLD